MSVDYKEPELAVCVLDYLKPIETRLCLQSLRAHLKVPHKIIYQDNGGGPDQSYVWQLYQDGLCDVLISKRRGGGGGVGQTDLFRFSDAPYTLFVQSDQVMLADITPELFDVFKQTLEGESQCIDLNGDQSRRGVWTDRAHLIKTAFFNSLGPFPNGGPGNDATPWNEAHLQKAFTDNGYQICHVAPVLFGDHGVWSVREAGDGLYRHRCDTKQIWVLKQPTYRTDVYPPFNDNEWEQVLDGRWTDGQIPEQWRSHSFRHWA